MATARMAIVVDNRTAAEEVRPATVSPSVPVDAIQLEPVHSLIVLVCVVRNLGSSWGGNSRPTGGFSRGGSSRGGSSHAGARGGFVRKHT